MTPVRQFQDLVAELRSRAQELLPRGQAELAQAFLTQYYHRVPSEVLDESDLSDLYGAAIAHWDLGRQREIESSLIKVYNPSHESHGWESTHTVVEIITDDRAFLVDSIAMVLNRHNLTIHLTIHPVIRTVRAADGRLHKVLHSGESDDQSIAESFMQFQIDRQTDDSILQQLRAELFEVIHDVARVGNDWKEMRDRLLEAAAALESTKSSEMVDEITALCHWVAADHFTFLGCIDLKTDTAAKARQLVPVPGTELGILRPGPESQNADLLTLLPISQASYLAGAEPLLITETSRRSTVHRPAYMDMIVVRRFDSQGNIVAESCVVGLFSAAAYNSSVREVPILRSKLQRVLERSSLPLDGHGSKTLQNIIENYPRNDLFQMSDEDLFVTCMGILDLQERQRVRLFSRHDRYGRFYSSLVYVPRDQFNSDLRARIGELLLEAYRGQAIEFDVYFSDSVLARIHYIIRVDPLGTPVQDHHLLEQQIAQLARSWTDDLHRELVSQVGEESGNRLFTTCQPGFPVSYQQDWSPRQGAHDVRRMDQAEESEQLGILLTRPAGAEVSTAELRLYSRAEPIPLSDILPVIENMGFKINSERPYPVQRQDLPPFWIHVFSLLASTDLPGDLESRSQEFEQSLLMTWTGRAENDGFNRLILTGGLNWRETTLLRSYFRFLRQIRFRYSQDYVIDTLSSNPNMTSRVVQLFHARFDPDLEGDRTTAMNDVMAKINAGLERILNLDEDRILQGFINAVNSTLRTNYYQVGEDATPAPYLSLKIDSAAILRMPEPRPMFEVFVCSPRVEAIHLRGGRVARGGIRWSDRPEDFRTEVLGLVKAQMVKNAVIVPVGSKGGFIVKQMPAGDRETRLAEAVACYQTFMRGMLDITDNLEGDTVIPPARVVRHDDDDPYLVVAADKGTATFSDIANAIAAEYGFWLDDAFASGGSSGYDHKGMGITARGAWESVKRLFRERDSDIQTEPFTVVGIGDMSGDVFGNGMLLSRQIRLIAAFNHLHIFLDPDPDPERSFHERQRLFELPRSSWHDYDRDIISVGGGVWPRTSKSIEISSEVRSALGISSENLGPNELINAILKAPVDLLWNGGIGTYIKASTESHEDVRDRANDTIRVNGQELRCKVLGEGGNLGATQLGRIEFSRAGGLCHTDAIDNSAGVDTSDHEVNIKIALNHLVKRQELTLKQRNTLLSGMTEEVAELVLRDNYNQTQALSLAVDRARELVHQHARATRQLERTGVLDPRLEFLPDEEVFAERIAAGEGLCRPEMAVLLSYSKLSTYELLLESDVPEDPFLSGELPRYFPTVLSEQYPEAITTHRLRREIIATQVTNSMVNRVGPGFTLRMNELTGRLPPDTARAYSATCEIFAIRDLWQAVESLDNTVDAAVQRAILHDAGRLIERGTTWLLRNRPQTIDIAETVAFFRDDVAQLWDSFPRVLAASNRLTQKRRVRRFLAAEIPPELANQAAGLLAMSAGLDIVEIARMDRHDVSDTATVYYDLGDRLGLHWLRDRISELAVESHWHSMSKFALRTDLSRSQRALAGSVLNGSTSKGKTAVRQWVTRQKAACDRFDQIISDLRLAGKPDFAMLSVAVSEAKVLQGDTGA